MRDFVTLTEAKNLPRWRRPVALLVLMAAALPFAHSTWMALLNNFVIEEAGFSGSDIGWLQSVREIPGLAAIGVLGLLVFIREQRLGLLMIMLSGLATAVVAWFPSFEGLLLTTMLSSLGFHYYETVNQSLQLQWIDKANAPRILGWIIAAGSAASLVVYVLLVIFWQTMQLSFNFVYMTGGMTAVF
ncbi:MAG TPA: MFS transporter, partial [Rhodobacteraceae bacterium]|nr:MFS transporter [Paracoccaceae bacterium]